MAAEIGDLAIVEMLIAENADANYNPSVTAYVYRNTALQFASERGHLDVVQRLLAAGADINATGGTAPPLLLAAQHGHIRIFDILLNAGADLHPTAYRGQTLLHAAESSNNAGMLDRVRAILDSQPQPQEEESQLGHEEGKLCKTCQTASLVKFFHGQNDSDKLSFHSSLTALKASVRTGCPFCCFILRRLNDKQPISLPPSSPVMLDRGKKSGVATCLVLEQYATKWDNEVPDPRERCRADFNFAIEPYQGETTLMTKPNYLLYTRY